MSPDANPGLVEATAAADATPLIFSEPPPLVRTEALIIAEGRRARDIVGHLRRSENRDVQQRDDRWHIAASPRDYRQLLSHAGQLARVIAVVLDEDHQERRIPSDGLDNFLREQAAEGALILLVPALSAGRPSRLFDPRERLPELARGGHAILDSAIARSPFWWGKSKRSFDRRVADVIALAVVACRSAIVRRELLQGLPGEAMPILTVGTMLAPSAREAPHDDLNNPPLGSEASWVSGDPKRSDPAVLFSARINPEEVGSYENESQIVVEGRKRENRFPEFAGRVLAPMFSRRRRAPGRPTHRLEQLPSVNSAINSALSMPEYCSSFVISDEALGSFSLAVTGETPTLDAVETASRSGWRIARYTDTGTLRRLAEESERSGTFPDEVDIGPLRSHPINRSLATRGVDQRDVIRVSYDLMSEWLDELSPMDRQSARENARPMRSATRQYGEPENDHLLMRDYVLGEEPAAQGLRNLLSRDGTPLAPRALKRSADLLKCWTPPSPGFQRYALVDGAVPVVLVELRDNEVPVQDLFVIDGDLAVPALFRSRVFGVWARATLPAASSWMARFSVASTFGGFPIAAPFRIIGQEGSLAALVADGASSSLMSELAREVSQHIERALASHPSNSWKAAHRVTDTVPAMARLNEMILAFYGLPDDSNDIVILRRLQQMNAAFD